MNSDLRLNVQKLYNNGIKKNAVFLVSAFFTVIAILYSLDLTPYEQRLQVFVRIGLVCYMAIASVILCTALRKVKEMHNLYLIFALLLGTMYFVAIPLGRIPDEPVHYSRIYELSEGTLFTPVLSDGSIGNMLPSGFNFLTTSYRGTLNSFNTFLDYDDRSFVNFAAAALYSPLCYIPQTLGVIFFRIFTNNAAVIFYGARLFNFLFGVIVIYFSIKIIPYGKMTVFIIAMMPMVMHQMVSVSADVPTNALSIFAISLSLYLAEPSVRVKKRHLLLLAVSVLILSMCKIVYIVFAVLVFLIPKDKFKSIALSRLFKILLVVGVIAVNCLWLIYTTRYFIPFREGVNMMEQIKYVLSDPLHYIKIMAKTLTTYFPSYMTNMSGIALGYLDIQTSYASYGTYILILLTAIFVLAEFVNSPLKSKLFMAFVFVVTVVLIFSALYAQWTPVSKYIIDGVQGRYFVPIVLAFAVFAPKIEGKNATKFNYSGRLASIPQSYMLYILIMFSNFIALADICVFYVSR